ncbi:MAG: porin family protein [Loktanella sp.]|nr:porin family protein [Loktanella sp.]
MKKLALVSAMGCAGSMVNAQGNFGDTWTGFYAGGAGAVGLFNSETTDHWCKVACDGASLGEVGSAFGIAAGYDMQLGSLVIGVVADYMTGTFETENVVSNGDGDPYASFTEASWDSIITLRGRAGVAVDRSLIYVSGGVAHVDVAYRHDFNFGPDADLRGYRPYSGQETGFAAGVGVEHAFADNLSISAEYLYVGLPSVNGGAYFSNFDNEEPSEDSTVTFRSSAHLIRVGANWRF